MIYMMKHRMKRPILILTALLGLGTAAGAQTANTSPTGTDIVQGVDVSGLSLKHNGNRMDVAMHMDLSRLDVSPNRAVLLTPLLANGGDTLALTSIGVYGRRRYYFYVRNGESMLSGPDEMTYRTSEKPDGIDYAATTPYSEWMNGAKLVLRREKFGCCSELLERQLGLLGDFEELLPYKPDLVYMRPNASGTKEQSIDGEARVEFRVDKTNVDPSYRQNEKELEKILATIEPLQKDHDITIKSVWLKGFASPESPYAHNTDLARGRTKAIKDYIQQLYHFKDGVIATDYEPENWEGLRAFVKGSNMDHRDEILAIIDNGMKPDPKEAHLKRTYPAEYRFLLQTCYPALRVTKYRIEYVIRTYTDVEEIKRVMKTEPHKLSLNEFYLAAQTYKSDSPEFNEVFDIAVRMYPNDSVANLNAANTAMQQGSLERAAIYLAKAGTSAQAEFARGNYAILTEDYDKATRHMQEAQRRGIAEAEKALREIEKRKKYAEKYR